MNCSKVYSKVDFGSRLRVLFMILFLPITCPNIDEFLFLPVALGYWKQHELWDGTYTLDDLLDIAELAEVRRENEERAAEAARE